MKRGLIGLAVVSAVTLVVGVGAGVARAPIQTDIEIFGAQCATTCPDSETKVFGAVSSPKGKCVPKRTVKVYAVDFNPASSELIGTDKTSKHGAFLVTGDFTDRDGATAKVTKKKIGRPGHRKTCASNSTKLGF